MKKIISYIFVIIGTSILYSTQLHAAQNNGAWFIRGHNSTGPNDVCDKPIWELPAPLPPAAHFTLLGEYDSSESATSAIPLQQDNCNSNTVLATTIDPEFQGFFGFLDPDPRVTNLRLNEVPVVASFDGIRQQLPVHGSPGSVPLPPTRSVPNEPVTLGDWFDASGKMWMRCRDGEAKVVAYFRHLIPNGVYSMFGIWLTTPPGANSPTFLPVAFGGVPNTLVANSRGSASFSRKLSYCPKGEQQDSSILMFVDLAYHSDTTTHGAFPFRPTGTVQLLDQDGERYESNLPPGVSTHVQMGFPVNVAPLP